MHMDVYVCDTYHTQPEDLSCLYGKCSCFSHTAMHCVFFLTVLLSQKNTELLTAFRIDCSGIVILFSVHVIIFNS